MFLSPGNRSSLFDKAEAIISDYTRRHVLMDVGIGAVGLLPIPWLGTASLLAAISIQGPAVYHPLARKLQALYESYASEHADELIDKAAFAGGLADAATEFTVDALRESARDFLQEHAAGLAVSALPVVGGIVAGTIDAFVAVKLTRMVGAMTIVYCENGGRWPASKNETADFVRSLLLAKPNATVRELTADIVGDASPKSEPEERAVDAATFTDGVARGLTLDFHAQNLSEPVLEALERWKDINPDSLSGLVEGFTNSATGVYANDQLISSLKGFVGEQVAASATGGSLPDVTNVPAWDIVYDGQHWQIKVGATAVRHATEAFQDHPEFPIMTDPESAATLSTRGVESIGISGLENSDLVGHTVDTASSLQDLAHLGPDFPVVSGILITFIELRKYSSGKCTLNQALTCISVKVGSRAAAISLATFVAVGLAASAGILPIAGPAIAGTVITASIGSRLIANRLLRLQVPASLQILVGEGAKRLLLARRFSVKARSEQVRAHAGPVAETFISAGTTVASSGTSQVKAAAGQGSRLLKFAKAQGQNLVKRLGKQTRRKT
jgi:hypothetical protein